MTKLVSPNVRGSNAGRNIAQGMIILASAYVKKLHAAFVSLIAAFKRKQRDYVRTSLR